MKKNIYLIGLDLAEEWLPLFDLCNFVHTDACNFPEIASEPISLFLSIQHVSFHIWFCSFSCRCYLTETQCKNFLIRRSHPDLIMLSPFSLFTFVSFFPFLIASELWQPALPILTLLLLVLQLQKLMSALASREVCSKCPREVTNWFNSYFSLSLEVNLTMLRAPPWAKSFIYFSLFHHLFLTLSHSVMADNYALFSVVSPGPLKVGLFFFSVESWLIRYVAFYP